MKIYESTLAGAAVRYPEIGQGRLSAAIPDVCAEDSPVVLALHGSGRGIEAYHTIPFYIRQRDICLSYGYTFAVLQNGPDTYGTDEGLHNTVLAAEELLKKYTSQRTLILWATSAGGVCAFRYAAGNPDKVRGIIGTFPVADLANVFTLLSSCRAAYDRKEGEYEAFAQQIRDKNPASFLPELRNIPMYIAHGTLDRAVPYRENALLLAEKAGAHLYTVEDGVHGTADFRYYDHAPHEALRTLRK